MSRHEVYFNLHKKCLSARSVYPPSYVFHAAAVLMENVKFAVQPAGRDKVRATGRKNVHAFVRGELLFYNTGNGSPLTVIDPDAGWAIHPINLGAGIIDDPNMQKITYNPYKYDTFVDANTLTPVYSADRVYIVGRDIYAVGVK